MNQTVAIIGYGTAAVNAIIALRSAGYAGKIQVFSDTGERPYSPMMTAAYAAGTCDYEGMFPWDACDLDQLDVQVVAAKVVALDADAHVIVTDNAMECAANDNARATGVGLSSNGEAERCAYAYDVCLIASGAHPRRAAWETASKLPEAARPLVLRTLQDAELLKEALSCENNACRDDGDVGDGARDGDSDNGDGCVRDGGYGGTRDGFVPRILVSGASMVALKAVDACLARGAEVTLLCRGEHILRRTAVEDVAAAFEEALAKKGVDVRLSQVIEETEALENGQVRVTFSNGDVTDYSDIVLAHGVVPNLDFLNETVFNPGDVGAGKTPAAKEAAVEETFAEMCGDLSRGIPVDEFMRTQFPHVYAAGDVARVLDFSAGAHRVAGLWKEACLQGAAAGSAMAAELAGKVPSAEHGYCGFVPSNCITAGDAVVLSAGSVSVGLNRWTEIIERNECLVAAVYEQPAEGKVVERRAAGEQVAGDTADEQPAEEEAANELIAGDRAGMPAQADERQIRLVGYNVFSENADPATSFAYDEAAMLYRRLEADRLAAKGGCHE